MTQSDDSPLDGTVALITGANSGIGAATAKTLARDGASVVLAARREERLDEQASTISADHDAETLAVPTDVTEEAEVATLFAETIAEFGRLDAVVCNAGVGMGEDVESMPTEEYRTMMDVNVDGVFFTAREAIAHLRETAGHLVFTSSFAGKYPRPFNPVYAATKWWTEGFARSLEASVGGDGIAVTTVSPSEVRTEFGSEDGQSQAEQFDPGEVIEPQEVAETIAFAVRQQPPTNVSAIDLYRRDKMSHF
jgi:hypothetical protein